MVLRRTTLRCLLLSKVDFHGTNTVQGNCYLLDSVRTIELYLPNWSNWLNYSMPNLRKIDPLLLEVLIAIADSGSFAAAAERVGRTKSAVSMQMKRLQTLFPNTPIFETRGRKRRFTQHGEQMLAHARAILQLNETLWRKMAQSHGSGIVRLGAPDDYAYALLPDILERFGQRFPHVQVELTCEPSEFLSERIGRNEIDLALVSRRPNDDASRVIRIEPVVWAKARGKYLDMTQPLPLAVFQPGCVARAQIIEACAKANLPYRIAYSSHSLAGILSPVRAGLAVAAIARCSVPDDLDVIEPGHVLPDVQGIDLALMKSGSRGQTVFVNHLMEEICASLAS
ncbi:LysR substrate-binding domain-containing protein [Rhizobium oryzicola]|uniref:LysR substrate-binding domain-containing protein n=1 Tax=Rhizobium oryzicola TaxID=1232668 RepID=A0ABT8SVH2_9HYPH|nr:LysR substrate-binding domain-containing protein [Rhizobium oryzicola]MDO1582449.1 LysR substrate-binding domain-containing protein [Rhizobium oryzicola]